MFVIFQTVELRTTPRTPSLVLGLGANERSDVSTSWKVKFESKDSLLADNINNCIFVNFLLLIYGLQLNALLTSANDC